MEEHKQTIEKLENGFLSEKSLMEQDFQKQINDIRDEYEVKLRELADTKENEKETQRVELQNIIDELQALLQEEKQKMGAAGKAREEELLGQIASLRKQIDDKDQYIDTLAKTIADLEKEIKNRDGTIEERNREISQLEEKIRRLELELDQATLSGDEATKNLRDQLKRIQEEYEKHCIKAKHDFDSMKDELAEKHKREMDAQRQKYEQMLNELQMNASNDKEFVQNELRKKIITLEKQIEDMRKEHGDEKSKLLEQMKETVSKLEEQIRLLK